MFYILKNLERLVEEMFLVRGLGFLMIWFYIIKKKSVGAMNESRIYNKSNIFF